MSKKFPLSPSLEQILGSENPTPQDATQFYEHKSALRKRPSSGIVSSQSQDPVVSNQPSEAASPAKEAVPTPSMSLDGSNPHPRYLIGRQLGRGGMGAVYEGWDVQLQRRVAIKIIRDEESVKPHSLLRFFREARIASRLRHPGIISIHEFDISEDGHAFIIMGMLSGLTLAEVLDSVQERTVELPSLIGTFLQICQAVAYAHSQGIIHRDLKPANIMVGRFGVVTVLDWGLAKIIGESEPPPDIAATTTPNHALLYSQDQTVTEPFYMETESGTVFGTPAYLSPEQANGLIDQVDKRSDVFGLGSILCEILTGHPTFEGKNLLEVHAKAAAGEVAPALEWLDNCMGPRPMVALAKRCLCPNPADRPADASELVRATTEYLESGQRRAEQELVRFFDLSLDLFCIANFNGYFCRVNNNFARVLGYTAENLTSCKFLEFIHPDDHADTIHEIEKLSRGEPTIQFLNRYRHVQGHYLWFEWTASSNMEDQSIYAVARDVTERIQSNQAHQLLKEEQLRLAEVINSAEVAIIVNDLNGIVFSWNKGAENIFGYAPEEIIGRSVAVLLPPELLHEEERNLMLLRQGHRVEHCETVRLHKDGRHLDISATISPIHDACGNIIGASKIARNISEHKDLRIALEKSRRELIDFADSANLPLHWVDASGTILWANQVELDLLGYKRNEYIGYPITRFHADPHSITELLQRLIAGQSLKGYRAQMIAKDSSIKQVALYSCPFIEDNHFKYTRCFTIDLTSHLHT